MSIMSMEAGSSQDWQQTSKTKLRESHLKTEAYGSTAEELEL